MRALLIVAFCLGAVPLAAASKDVPSWVTEVSSRTTPSYSGKVPATVLLEEQHVTIDPSGLMTIVKRAAIKILTREGQSAAEADDYYYKGGRQVKQLHAWLIAPNGFEKTFDKSSVADIGAFSDMVLYDDIRLRSIKAENPELGSVFAYETEVEEKAQFAQDEYDFQSALPCVRSRYVLTLPAGWTAQAVVFNHAPIQPIVDGSTYTWELKDLPYREHEEHGTSMRAVTPRLAVDFRPPANAPAFPAALFRSWTDVSRWQAALAAGQDEVTPEISTKVAQLTANAATAYDKIRAIARYVQQIRYVAIEMDLAHGGGYKPHRAASVFEKQYGDCKDKANLMRTMLKAAGLSSYLVAIYSGDRTYVDEAWPSPTQFNHMILAVRAPDASSVPTLIPSPLGPLLIFDPTDPTTPLGDLPWYEQGSFALLCAGDQGTLLKMPATTPEANAVDLNVDATLGADGDLTVSLSTADQGQPAHIERAGHANHTPDEYRLHIQRLLNERARDVTIAKLATEDLFDQNRFRLKVDFHSHGYAQLMQQRLLVFAPSVVAPSAPFFSQSIKRTEPIVLRAGLYRKQVTIKLPEGFSVDEMPEPLKSESRFASFSLTFRQEPGRLVMQEELRTEAVTLPAGQYSEVKKFFDTFSAADNQNAVLVKN